MIKDWWWQLRPGVRRGIRGSAVFLLLGIISTLIGVTTAQFTGSLGPHSAEYAMTANGEVRVDLGPLGALIMASPIPVLGVMVHVGEIPTGLGIEPNSLLSDLSADLNSYLQFFSHPAAAIEQARDGLIKDALHRTVLAWSISLMLIAIGRLAAHGVLRAAALSAWKRKGVPILTITTVLAVAAVGIQSMQARSPAQGQTTTVLADTALADARITGRLGEVIDYYGRELKGLIADNDTFYAEAENQLRAKYAADAHPVYPGELIDSPATKLLLAEQELAQQELADEAAQVDPSPDPAAEPTPEPVATVFPAGAPAGFTAGADPDPVNLVVVADLHCNMGMARVIAALAEVTEAELIVNLGDTVMSGTQVESVCVDAFAREWQGTPVVVADGNHDSVLTAAHEREAGWHVLSGEPIEVAGITFLGDTDPTLTGIGVPTHSERDESVLQMGERLAAQACELLDEGKPIDILAIHQPYAGRQTVEAGCAPFTMSGHFHSQSGPWQRGWGWQYISSTSGGAQASIQFGPLNAQARLTQLQWDRANGLPIGYRIIKVNPNGSVNLGPWYAFPPAPTESVEPVIPAGIDDPWG